MKQFVYPLDNAEPLTYFTPLAQQPYALWFDSARPGHPLNRYSYICWNPVETIEINPNSKENPFDILKQRLAAYKMPETDPALPPFQGGAAGFFSYDLGRFLEKLPTIAEDNPDMPVMAIGIYDQIMAFDHKQNKAWLIIHADNGKQAENKRKSIPPPSLAPLPSPLPRMGGGIKGGGPIWIPDCDDKTYLNKIRTIIDYIHQGEVYQVNLSRRFESPLSPNFDPFAHYCRLRDINAAPFSAYLNFGSTKLAATSPERFLSVQNGEVDTRPIKGTKIAAENPDSLLRSPKDRAENTMIVDLMRNDISKVCEAHSVKVQQLCGVESFEGVHHLVSIIKGTLRQDKGPVDLLAACFPGGSITGAPKIRAMEIIEALEPARRGPYCGAIGMIGFDGFMDTAMTIRTLVYHGSAVQLQTGGGIVADSSPAAELQETLDKAQKIFESFGRSNPTKAVA